MCRSISSSVTPSQRRFRRALVATLAQLGFVPALVLEGAVAAFGAAALDTRGEGPHEEGEHDGQKGR
jgi:hypothetical protein